MRKILSVSSVSLLVVLLFAGIASAHVVVYPQTAIQGTYEKFTVRVPTEQDSPTVKVEVLIPAEVDISRFEPMPGWKYDLTKDATGKITSVVWTATGEGLANTEFGEFNMQGKIAANAASLVWRAHQTYKDGSIVDWTGAPEDKTPASVTKINPVPKNATIADDGDMDRTDAGSSSKLPLYISFAALLLGASAFLLALGKR